MDTVLILINAISEKPSEDEKDVLDQAEAVETALHQLGYHTERTFLDLNLEEARRRIELVNPRLVFNLVEGVAGKANLIFLAPALLESMNMHYTGCRLESMFLTSNKILTKKILQASNLPTPRSHKGGSLHDLNPHVTYIAKPLWEDASVGITDTSVFRGDNGSVLQELQKRWGPDFFVEEFIDGREFNLSILAGEDGQPQVLPLAEILFTDFPRNKPRIVGYAAKWEKDTFEYINTPRTFEVENVDDALREKLISLCRRCWQVFDLKGYARVDFRVDQHGNPFILEINANPCISPDAGFYAACLRAGIPFPEAVKRIVADSGLELLQGQ